VDREKSCSARFPAWSGTGFEAEKSQDEAVLQVLGAIKSIRYGYVQITVHNGQVVQIDRTEKIRLSEQKPKAKRGDG